VTKKRVLVYLASDFHARSFFSGELPNLIEKLFDLTLVITEEIKVNEATSKFDLRRVESRPKAGKLFGIYLDASLVRNLSKSSSFRFRLIRFLLGDYPKKLGFSPLGVIRLVKACFFALPGVYQHLCKRYRISVIRKSDLAKIVNEKQIDLVICWCSSMEPATLETILISKGSGAKSLLVYDNWDNLSSKAVMLDKPDFLVCFGDQSKKFAQSIHQVPIDSVYALGSARFDVYKGRLKRDLNAESAVLIAGSSIALEDREILRVISSELNSSTVQPIFKKSKFFHRPHPAPQGLSVNLEEWEFPEIDLEGAALSKSKNKTYWQNQLSLANTLSSKKVVIAAPTTLLLEALLSGCYVIVPALPVKSVRTSMRKMLLELEHLKGLAKLPNLVIAYDEQTLIEETQKALSSPYIDKDRINLGMFLTTNPGTFASRFTDLLSDLMKD